jgi:hypothetical protein
VSVQGNSGGNNQSWGSLKSTVPPENTAPSKRTVPPGNTASLKLTAPPENTAPLKLPPSKTTPEKSKFKPYQDTAAPSLRCAVMTRMTVWRTSRLARKASRCGSGASWPGSGMSRSWFYRHKDGGLTPRAVRRASARLFREVRLLGWSGPSTRPRSATSD